MSLHRIQEEPSLVPYQAGMPPPAQKVLVLAPHPDDEVFGCGGTVRLHALGGCAVDVVVVTDGSGAGQPTEREAESRAACRLLSLGDPAFWGYTDRALAFDEDLLVGLTQQIEHTLNTGAYGLVYAPSPWEVHPDHRAVAFCVAQALLNGRSSRATPTTQWAAYEVGAPLWPSQLVDITQVWAEKQAAMQVFASQRVYQDYSAHISALNRYRTYTLGPQCVAAEALWLPKDEDLRGVVRAWRDGFAHPGPY